MKNRKHEQARAQFSARRAQDRPTIVGGRPPESQGQTAGLSRGIERVIWLAAVDEDFRKLLFSDRQAALDKCKQELSAGERAVLASISNDQLQAVIGKTEVPEPARSSVLSGIAKGVGVLAILGSILTGASCSDSTVSDDPAYSTTGVRPDREYVEQVESEEKDDAQPSDE